MSTSNPSANLSPTMSTLSESSYDMIASISSLVPSSSRLLHTPSLDDSDDEIVWSLSDDSISSGSSSEDYVVLSPPGSPALPTATGSLTAAIQSMTLSAPPKQSISAAKKAKQPKQAKPVIATKKRKPRKKVAKPTAALDSPFTETLTAGQKDKSTPKKKNKKKKQKTAEPNAATPKANPSVLPTQRTTSPGQGPLGEKEQALYDEASQFITSFLENPEARTDKVYYLTLLQSLIVELGFGSTSLPPTLTAAKKFLHSHAFINVKEYINIRKSGPTAICKIMHPSRKALIKDIKKKGNPASLKWVKSHGLNVLLVTLFR